MTGDQYVGGMVFLKLGSLLGPTQGCERPQVTKRTRFPARRLPGAATTSHPSSYFSRTCCFAARDVDVAGVVVPGRYAVPPPLLAAYRPVTGCRASRRSRCFRIASAQTECRTVFHGLDGGFSQRLDFRRTTGPSGRVPTTGAGPIARGVPWSLWSSTFSSSPAASRSATTCCLASNRSRPRYAAGALSLMAAASVNTLICGKSWRAPSSLSLKSCAGVIFTQPVPNSGST